MARILLVDDNATLLLAVAEVMTQAGHQVVTATSSAQALERLDGVEMVVTDYAMPGGDGLELLRKLKQFDEGLPIVIMTAQGSSRIAVQAIKGGAYDYLEKPFDLDELVFTVARALEARAYKVQCGRLTAERSVGKAVIAESAVMKKLLADTERAAPRDITILVTGETGTGKELIASLVHAHSRRAAGPLVRFNCAALPPELAEAELFGHTRGAYTGAHRAHRGFFESASGGTLVLDEVGELPLAVQAKLLRVLQEGEIQPVGSGRVERVDVRVVACTNRSLLAEVRAGRFREDLYYRLAVVGLEVPPLRARREDIAPLAATFLKQYSERFGVENASLSPGLLERLTAYAWPGNVRQLENSIARMLALGAEGEGELGPERFVEPDEPARAPDASEESEAPLAAPQGLLGLREHLEAIERGIIVQTLQATNHNKSEAARRLGLSRSAFCDRLEKFELD